MTEALQNFHRAIGDSRELLTCYDTLNLHPELSPPSSLKKASLVLTLTAWETYVEDVATELFNNKFSLLKGSTIGNFAEKQFNDRLKQFNTPNSCKTKQLFEEFFGLDVTEYWNWPNVLPKDAREQLNKWIKLRGEAVHRANVDPLQPHIIKKDELAKCLRFFEEIAKATDVVLEKL